MKYIILILTLASLSTSPVCCAEKIPGGEKTNESFQKENNEGLSISNPIKIKKILTEEDVRKFQHNYIREHYPDFKIINTSQMEYIEKFYLEDSKGNKIKIYFDISDHMKDWKKKNRKSIEKSRKEFKKAILREK